MWWTLLLVFPSEVQVSVWMFRWRNIILDFLCGKVYYSNNIIITILMWILFPSFRFENILPLLIALKSPNKNFIWYLGKCSKTCPNSSWKLSFESTLFSSLGACTLKTAPVTSQKYIWHLITKKTNLLTADTILWCKRKPPFPNWWFLFPSP